MEELQRATARYKCRNRKSCSKHCSTLQRTLVLMSEGSLPRDIPRQYLTPLSSSRNAVAVILKVAYGYQVAEEGDPFVHIIEEGFRLSNNLVVPGKYWVEFMPFCQYSSSSMLNAPPIFIRLFSVQCGLYLTGFLGRDSSVMPRGPPMQ